MGTRADFYVGKGVDAEWLGSIAWDGYPSAIPDTIGLAKSEEHFRAAVDEFIDIRDDGTKPDQGWPWPWDDSGTTDCAYAWHDGAVQSYYWAKHIGKFTDEELSDEEYERLQESPFPDMSSMRALAIGTPRDSIMVFGIK